MKKVYSNIIMRFAILLLASILFQSCSERPFSEKQLRNKIREDANAAAKLIINREYDSYVNFMHPETIRQAGGKAAAIEVVKKMFTEEVESYRATIASINYGEPSKIISVNEELQTTIPEVINTNVNEGMLTIKGTSIALSSDQGKSWKFISASDKDLDQLKNSYPNLSSQLIIPLYEEPSFIKNKDTDSSQNN